MASDKDYDVVVGYAAALAALEQGIPVVMSYRDHSWSQQQWLRCRLENGRIYYTADCPANRYDSFCVLHSERLSGDWVKFLDGKRRYVTARLRPNTDGDVHEIGEHWGLWDKRQQCYELPAAEWEIKLAALLADGWIPDRWDVRLPETTSDVA